jgi:hypothetical protein
MVDYLLHVPSNSQNKDTFEPTNVQERPVPYKKSLSFFSLVAKVRNTYVKSIFLLNWPMV